MNTKKVGGVSRIAAFLLVAITVICTISVVASGWQQSRDTQHPDNDKSNGEVANNGEKQDGKIEDSDKKDNLPDVSVPDYFFPLTGLASESETNQTAYGILLNGKSTLYGISCADLLIEFETEDGTYDIAALFSDLSGLGKIGAFGAYRPYLSDLLGVFGAPLLYRTSVTNKGESAAAPAGIDFSKVSGYTYKESESRYYSNVDLIRAALRNESANAGKSVGLPFRFVSYGEEIIGTAKSANLVSFGDTDSARRFTYGAAEKKYIMQSEDGRETDPLNGGVLAFDNLFLLFSDSVLYEEKEGTNLSFSVKNGGTGYYMTRGGAQAITWLLTDDGNLRFFDASGELLSVNRGKSFISLSKNAKEADLIIK